MAETGRSAIQSNKSPRKHGLIFNLLWAWPWKVLGILLASLMLSLLLEYVGITLFWPEQGAEHSRQVMEMELRYLSADFTRSLLLSDPVTTLMRSIATAYSGVFVESGFISWTEASYQLGRESDNALTRGLAGSVHWLSAAVHPYLLATVHVCVISLIRVCILILSVPLFVMVIGVAVVEGLGRRDLRRFGAGYESSFLYHRAKNMIKTAAYLPVVIYLSCPWAVYPNLILLPAAVFLGVVVAVTVGAFKKYL